MNSFKEKCWFLNGLRLAKGVWVWRERYVSEGSTAIVGFDWEACWDDKRLIGWRHTHPGVDFDMPSTIDDRTMSSWVKAAGRPMVCGVTCGPSTKYYLYARSPHTRRVICSTLAWCAAGLFVAAWVNRRMFIENLSCVNGAQELSEKDWSVVHTSLKGASELYEH